MDSPRESASLVQRLGTICLTLVVYGIIAIVVARLTDTNAFHVVACMALASAVIQSVDRYYG